MNVLYQFGRAEPVKDFDQPKTAEMFCLGHTWHQPETWGTWTNKEASELGFRVKSVHQHPAIFLGLTSPPGGGSILIFVNGKQAVTLGHFVGKKIVRVSLDDLAGQEASAPEFVPIRLRVVASKVQNMKEIAKSEDVRLLGAGYLFMIAFDRTSLFERLEFMEKIVTNEI